MSTQTQQAEAAAAAKIPKWRRKLPLLLVAPYLVGILWHALHPLVSVFTGHMEPRKYYIDENSLEPSYFRMKLQFEALNMPNEWQRRSLCAAVPRHSRISCTLHPDGFEVVRVTPTQTAVRPVTEAIVLVIPWNTSQVSKVFQVSFLYLIQQLQQAKWLAKTVLIVTGTVTYENIEENLATTVDRFLEVYLGPVHGHSFRPPLPNDMTGLLLRNLLVVNVQQQQQQQHAITPAPLHEINILPQGRRGVLPNMDLVFLTMFVYSRSLYTQTRKAVITMHPYRNETSQILDYAQSKSLLPKEFKDWFPKMLQFLAFEYSLALGPFPPHATALDRGIDALTIQALLATGNDVDPDRVTSDVIQRLEYILRALSNLHERLHHSTSLYLLASPERFVKHEEYLVPNLLLLIPLVVRAITLVLVDIPTFQWPTVKHAICMTLVWVAALHNVVFQMDNDTVTMGFVFLYVAMVLFLRLGLRRLSKQTIQFVACTAALLIHIPIAFGHVSLAFPSALLWTPLIAFPSFTAKCGFGDKETRGISILTQSIVYVFSIAAISITLPSVLLVPRVFADYTVYVRYGYMPLHVLLTILYLS